ncbi:hypothetical protein BDQ17DRAFT_1430050 [Cyathus striatus]|nr:hypothetical protein BDQ17DRAFT_1430050 [Cyathus striatus]
MSKSQPRKDLGGTAPHKLPQSSPPTQPSQAPIATTAAPKAGMTDGRSSVLNTRSKTVSIRANSNPPPPMDMVQARNILDQEGYMPLSSAAPHSGAIRAATLHNSQVPMKLVNPGSSEPNSMGNLSSHELVEKANLALSGVADATHNCPDRAKIVAAHHSGGQIILEANSVLAVGWLREKEVMLLFISHFDGSSTPNLSLFSVIAEFVPTSFHPSPSYDFGTLEASNGL